MDPLAFERLLNGYSPRLESSRSRAIGHGSLAAPNPPHDVSAIPSERVQAANQRRPHAAGWAGEQLTQI